MGPGEAIVAALNPVTAWQQMKKAWNNVSESMSADPGMTVSGGGTFITPHSELLPTYTPSPTVESPSVGTITLDPQSQALLNQLNSNWMPIHGNSAANPGLQHGYEIYDHQAGDIHKYGISGQKLNKNGTSPRASRQLGKLNKPVAGRFSARVVKQNMAGRKKALNWEKGKVKGYKKANPNGDKPPGQINPNP